MAEGDGRCEVSVAVLESCAAPALGEAEGEVGLLGLTLGGLIALEHHDGAVPVGEFGGACAEVG